MPLTAQAGKAAAAAGAASDCAGMAQQQPGPGSSPQPAYLHTLPACVLEEFCQKMDCLNDYDWMRFGESGELRGEGAEGLLTRSEAGRGRDRSKGRWLETSPGSELSAF